MEHKSKTTAFLLCYALGALGAHRFYLNRVLSGILMLLTGGGLGIWWLVDCFLVITDRLKDSKGNLPQPGPSDLNQRNAGFWVRTAAICADNLLITLPIMVIGIVAAVALPSLMMDPASQTMVPLIGMALGAVVMIGSLLYFSLPLASQRRATWGKRAFGLYVVTADEQRLGIGRAIWRTLCYFISAIPLYLGFVLAGLGEQKRALHDRLAGTRVLYAVDGAGQGAASAAVNAFYADSAPAASEPDVPTLDAEPTVQHSTGGPLGMLVVGLLLLGAAAFVALA